MALLLTWAAHPCMFNHKQTHMQAHSHQCTHARLSIQSMYAACPWLWIWIPSWFYNSILILQAVHRRVLDGQERGFTSLTLPKHKPKELLQGYWRSVQVEPSAAGAQFLLAAPYSCARALLGGTWLYLPNMAPVSTLLTVINHCTYDDDAGISVTSSRHSLLWPNYLFICFQLTSPSILHAYGLLHLVSIS